jgi:hypothetical protein
MGIHETFYTVHSEDCLIARYRCMQHMHFPNTQSGVQSGLSEEMPHTNAEFVILQNKMHKSIE